MSLTTELTPELLQSAAATAIPQSALNRPLLKAFQERKQLRYLNLVNACVTKLKVNLDDLRDKLTSLSPERKWAPAIHCLFDNLAKAMKTGQVDEILDALMEIVQCDEAFEMDMAIKTSSILTGSWERKYVERMRQYEQKDMHGRNSISRPFLAKADVDFHAENIRKAIELIKTHDVEMFSEIQVFVSQIKIFHGRVLRGETSAQALGAVWLRVPEPEDDQIGYWIEHIIHETSHIRLQLYMELDGCVLNLNSEKKFKAPIRDDPRPMWGVFHASFVLARMMRVFKLISLAGHERRFRDRLQLCRLQFQIGLDSVWHPDARFTENGERIRDTLEACSSPSA